jgi:hypothetical protein
MDMPFMTTPERLARTEVLLKAIEDCLELKFGAVGFEFMAEVREIRDVEILRATLEGIKEVDNFVEMRRYVRALMRPEEERNRSFMTAPERHGYINGLLEAIEPYLELKFGLMGLRLMPEIREIKEVGVLRAVLHRIKTAWGPDELRRIWAP